MTRRKKIILIILSPFLLILVLVIIRIPFVLKKEKTAEVVQFIQTQKITMEDVDGRNLPPTPPQDLVDSTIEGVDANLNGIRDDVELEIFRRYPDSARIRSAMLQYAKALQLELTHVFNSETWVAAAVQDSRGYACLSQTHTRDNLEEYFSIIDERIKKVEELQFNTTERIEIKDKIKIFTTSISLPAENFCDISPESLLN